MTDEAAKCESCKGTGSLWREAKHNKPAKYAGTCKDCKGTGEKPPIPLPHHHGNKS